MKDRKDVVYLFKNQNISLVCSYLAKLLKEMSKKNNIEKILVKPNVVGPYSSELGVTTDPLLVSNVCKMIHNNGFRVNFGDCPGGNNDNIRGTFQKTGMLDKTDSYYKNINVDLIKYTLERYDDKFIYINSGILDTDLVISLPKFKTSCFMILTGAVKNLYGLIPGSQKALFHLEFPQRDEFAEFLIDVSLIPKKVIGLIDGKYLMEGNGPVHGRLRKENIYILSKSIYAADYIMAKLMGLDFKDVPTINASIKHDLLNIKKVKVNLINSQIKLSDFKLPITLNEYQNQIKYENSPEIDRIAKVEIVYNEDKCVKCYCCENNCPTGAIKIHSKQVINSKLCIRCFCCNELCATGAITLSENVQKIWNSVLIKESKGD